MHGAQERKFAARAGPQHRAFRPTHGAYCATLRAPMCRACVYRTAFFAQTSKTRIAVLLKSPRMRDVTRTLTKSMRLHAPHELLVFHFRPSEIAFLRPFPCLRSICLFHHLIIMCVLTYLLLDFTIFLHLCFGPLMA